MNNVFRHSLKKPKPQIILSVSTHFITDIYASFIIGLIPILTIKFGLSFFLVSVLTAVNFISSNITQPAFGYLSDKYGVRYFMVFGPLSAAIFLSLLGLSFSYWFVLIFLFLGNLGISAIHPPTAAVANYFGGFRKGFLNSIISLGGTVGFSIGSLLIILIINKLGPGYTIIGAIPGIIIAIIVFKYSPAVFPRKAQKSSQSFNEKIKSLKKKKIILLGLVTLSAYSKDLVIMTMFSFMPLYFTGQGLKLINFGYLFMVFNLIGGFGGILAGHYSDRMTKKTYLLQAGLIISVPLFFFMLKAQLFWAIVLFILAGFFIVSTLPLCIRIAQDIFPGNASLASSIVMGVSVGCAAASVMLIGKIADLIGITETINYVLILPVIAFLALFLFPYFNSKNNT